jgi:hypothetical protein
MPEVSDAQLTEYHQYKAIAPTPDAARGKIEGLEGDNKKQRDEIRDLKETAKKVPPEGAKVLSADEAKAWDAYTALGTPEEQAKRAEDIKTLEAKDAERTRLDTMKAAVAAEKMPEGAADLLADSKRADGATYSVAKEKQRGQDGKESEVEVGYITLAGQGQKPMRLADFAKESLPALLSLGTQNGSGGSSSAGSRAAHEASGTGSARGPVTTDDVRKSTVSTVDYTL